VQREFAPCAYLMANRKQGALYVGATSNLIQRVWQHREGVVPGFTDRYGLHRLVWFELHGTMREAIIREKRIKKWNRDWKIRLLEEANPDWRDLAVDLGFEPIRTPYTTNVRHPREGGDPTDDSATQLRREMDSRLRGNDEGFYGY
jgi:putative endonuclease